MAIRNKISWNTLKWKVLTFNKNVFHYFLTYCIINIKLIRGYSYLHNEMSIFDLVELFLHGIKAPGKELSLLLDISCLERVNEIDDNILRNFIPCRHTKLSLITVEI